MADNKKPNENLPGENPVHYNPGNMAGKKREDTEQTDENRGEPSHDERKEKPAG